MTRRGGRARASMVETEQAASLQVLEWSEVRRMVRERTATPLGPSACETS